MRPRGAERAADLTNAFVEGSARILEASEINARRREDGKLPGNLILTRDGGDHRPNLEPIAERFGMPWGCFVEMPVERGISIALGMQPVDAPRLDATGFGPAAEERYAEWAHLAADALGDFQALYVHIKGPDVPAHDGRAEDKRDVVTAIDRAFFGEVLPRLAGDTLVAVTADHATSCLRKAHTADPVPLLVERRTGAPRTARARSESGHAPRAPSASCSGHRSCRGSARSSGTERSVRRLRLRIPAPFPVGTPPRARGNAPNRVAVRTEQAYHPRR